MEIKEILERVGIKGTPEQLTKSVPLVAKFLTMLEGLNQFPIEVHLNKGELDQSKRKEEIILTLASTIEKSKEINHQISKIAIHIPFRFQEKPFNLATYQRKIWKNSIEMLRIGLDLIKTLEKLTRIETILVVHAYALSEYENTSQGLKYINHHCDLLRVYQALMKFSKEERKKIGIETTGTGPCSAPKDLIALARSTSCFIVQDVAHLLRRFYLDEMDQIHQREYNDLNRLKAAASQMLPYTKHWHICQHEGGPVHYDGHLANQGIIDWSRFIPLMAKSFTQNQATAIIEVKGLEFEKPLESFGSLLLIHSLFKEYFQKNLKAD